MVGSKQGFSLEIRVYYEDTDAGGIVYYANYLKYMERARTEFLRELGFEQDRLRDSEKRLFVVNNVNVNYVTPVRFNALMQVSANPVRVGRASVAFAHEVHLLGKDANQTSALACHGLVKLACIHADTFKPAAIPTALHERLDR